MIHFRMYAAPAAAVLDRPAVVVVDTVAVRSAGAVVIGQWSLGQLVTVDVGIL